MFLFPNSSVVFIKRQSLLVTFKQYVLIKKENDWNGFNKPVSE